MGTSTARVNGPTLKPRKQQLFLQPDNHQRSRVRDCLPYWSSALSPHPGCLCSAPIDAQTHDWASPGSRAVYLVAIQLLILKIIFIAQGERAHIFSIPTWTDLVGFSLEEEEFSKVPLKIKIDFTFYSFALKPWAEVEFAVIIIVY